MIESPVDCHSMPIRHASGRTCSPIHVNVSQLLPHATGLTWLVHGLNHPRSVKLFVGLAAVIRCDSLSELTRAS